MTRCAASSGGFRGDFIVDMGKITHLSTHTDGQRKDGGTNDGTRGFRGGFIGRLQGRLHCRYHRSFTISNDDDDDDDVVPLEPRS